MVDVAALRRPVPRPVLGQDLMGAQRNVRRCLFGPVDHELTKAILEEQQKKQIEQDKERWNFDFEKELPIPSGRYQWCLSNDSESEKSSDKAGVEEKGRKQTQITDFMRKRKYSPNHKNEVTSQPKVCRRSST